MDGERPEWLPVGWKVCVRVRTSGKKDKYYVNPSKGLKFSSKPEVLQYLKNAVEDPKARKLNKADIKRTVSERLPSTSMEVTRITRSSGKTKRTLHFIDPVSGCGETKNSDKADCTRDEELEDHCKSSTAEFEGQKLIDEKVAKISSVNESLKTDENIKPPETQNEKDSTAEDGQQEKAAAMKKRKKHSKWINGLPRRASKRLARVEADPAMELNSSSRAREADRSPNDTELNTDDANVESKMSGEAKANTSEDVEATTTLPAECASVASRQAEENKKKLESSLNDLFMDPCIEFAIKTLTGAIPLEEVSKICGGPVASPVQASASPSVLPLSDIWADPCFEFAVKTLTSEIPTEDDSHFQISFSSGPTGCSSIAK